MTRLIGYCTGTAIASIAVVVLGNHLLPPASATPNPSTLPSERMLRDSIEENWKLRGELFEERCRTAELVEMVARDRLRREQATRPYTPPLPAGNGTDPTPGDLIPRQALPIPVPMQMPARRPARGDRDD